jgi:hypothetical protein
VLEALDAAGIDFALIGGIALAAHGSLRSTLDLDLLALDARCLREQTWSSLIDAGIKVEIRKGDDDDPLLGVVRIDEDGPRPIDIILGRSPRWQHPILERARARMVKLEDRPVPLVEAADLVLLKLYAGGIQDRADILDLLSTDDALVPTVEERVAGVPRHARELWATLKPEPPQ